MRAVPRAWAYITSEDRLLVFDQPEHPGERPQIPGGRFHAGETPNEAVLREAREETGFPSLVIVRALGEQILSWGGYTSRIHAFHLVFSEPVPEHWEHGEFMNDVPVKFAFEWMAIDQARDALWPEQAAFLARLEAVLRGT